MKTSHRLPAIIVLAAVALATASVLAIATSGGAFDQGTRSPALSASSCSLPSLPGTVIGATLINMGGPMMARPATP